MKILIVDDEEDICEMLQFNLESEGYEVAVAYSAEEALQLPLASFDLVLLDVMMEKISGFEMARILKKNPSTTSIPIIFTTALGDEWHTVEGLEIGAEDYMKKPLSMKEVKARVKVVLRRTGHTAPGKIIYEGITINELSKSVTVDVEPVQLTKLEYELLHLFITNRDKVFSREDLLSKCWPSDTFVLDRTVDVNITRLRKKIGKYGKYLKTRFGYGYTFETEIVSK